MAVTKPFCNLPGNTPLAAAGEKVLGERLRAVVKYARLAATRAQHDPEHVHQLRVATRRARAALRLFGDLLPSRLRRRLRKQLRLFRRAAGAARDCDVFWLQLAPRLSSSPPESLPGLHWLAGQVGAQRRAAQAELAKVYETQWKALQHSVRQAVRHLASARRASHPARDLNALAAAHLPPLLRSIDKPGPINLHDPHRLHALRIQAKRLRYAMEVFAGCLPLSSRREYDLFLRQLQEALGKANDATVALDLLHTLEADARRFSPDLWPVWEPGLRFCAEVYLSRRERAVEEARQLVENHSRRPCTARLLA